MKFVVGEPYVHRSKLDPPMSPLGQKRARRFQFAMSALPPKAGSRPPSRDAMSGHSNFIPGW
jgi:hypothetical protein